MVKVYQYTMTDKETFENVFKDAQILMNHVIIPPGQVFPQHPTDAIVYALIIRGEVDAAIENDAPKTFRAGQLVNIPKGVNTELGNRGDAPVELFVVKHEYDL